MSVRLQFHEPVSLSGGVKRRMRALCQAVHDTFHVPHRLTVHVVPAPAVGVGRGIGFGAFWSPSPGKHPQIWLAGISPPELSPAEHDEMLAEVLAHEFAHYEQYRDGRKLQERGVAVRGRTIQRMLEGAVPQKLRRK